MLHLATVAVSLSALAALILLQSALTSPESTWPLRAALAGFAALALLRPAAAALVTIALVGFSGILAVLFRVPALRVTELLVITSLFGLFVRSLPSRSTFRQALSAAATAPVLLFALAALTSMVVWLRVQQVETGYAPEFLRSLFNFVSREYFGEPGDFRLVVSTAVVVEGLGLFVAVRALCRADPDFVDRAMRMLAVGGAGLAVMSVIRLGEIVLRDPNALAILRNTPNGLRVSPQIPDYIAAGAYFSLCWLVALGLGFFSTRRRALWFGLGVPLIVAVYLTGSRSVIIAAVLGIAVLATAIVRLRARSARKVLVAGVIGAALMLAFYPALIGRDLAGDMARKSLDVRVELARTSLRITALRPLFGVGLDRYHLFSERLASRELRAAFPARKTAHNELLRVAAELGLVGLAIWLFIVVGAARATWRALRSTRDVRLAGLAGGLAAFGVAAMVSNPLLVPEVSYAFWFALGLAVAHSASTPAAAVVAVPSRRAWLAAAAVAAALVFSIPIRARQELATVDLTRYSYGFYGWENDDQGSLFRWTGAHATLFVNARGRAIEIPVSTIAVAARMQPQVELFVDGQLADRVIVGAEWRRLRTLIPERRGRYRRIDLRVSPTWVPAQVYAGTADWRELGVKVGEISVVMPPPGE